ncbi:hypothetical protein FVE85_9702 [Porphyridium purpureum]|uniref:Uncharacterized protein n=1 Tax=Porphyridium purpureum TaxID=35688 RepID=A0A5J4YKK8_PORPP|nr:hypothetical protein FVE85_9702 [Porphyridium purpureum]|eukprot:POR8830..scf246_12
MVLGARLHVQDACRLCCIATCPVFASNAVPQSFVQQRASLARVSKTVDGLGSGTDRNKRDMSSGSSAMFTLRAALPSAEPASEFSTRAAFCEERGWVCVSMGTRLMYYETRRMAHVCGVTLPDTVQHLVHVSSLRLTLAFLERNKLPGAQRGIAYVQSSKAHSRPFVVYSKFDSSSVWCMMLNHHRDATSPIGEIFKLRADLVGSQHKVNVAKGGAAKVQASLATKRADKMSDLSALVVHPVRAWAAAAYVNGIVRVFDIAEKHIKHELDTLNNAGTGERTTALALHPLANILVACTNKGRILTWRLGAAASSTPGDAPEKPKLLSSSSASAAPAATPTHKVTEKVTIVEAMFHGGGFSHAANAPLFLALTIAGRLICKNIGTDGTIIPSALFPKPSAPLLNAAGCDHTTRMAGEPVHGNLMLWNNAQSAERAVTKSKVYVMRPLPIISGVFQSSAILAPGIDTPFSTDPQNVIGGTVMVRSDAVFAADGKLYVYSLQKGTAVPVCELPRGSVYRLCVAYGSTTTGSDSSSRGVVAVLVFMASEPQALDEGEMLSDLMYVEAGDAQFKYVMCTKRGENENDTEWNVSEPQEGRDGCFLGPVDNQNRLLVISASGAAFAAFQFRGDKSNSLGMHRAKFASASGNAGNVTQTAPTAVVMTRVFASPMNNGNAVVYFQRQLSRLVASQNWRFGAPEHLLDADDETAVPLQRSERVLDLRWQQIPSGGTNSSSKQYLAVALTSKRILFFKNRLEPLSALALDSVAFGPSKHRAVVATGAPLNIVWNGPVVALLMGAHIYSISIKAKADLLASCSRADAAPSCLIAALPDRVIYGVHTAAAGGGTSRENRFAIISRSAGFIQPSVFGALGIPSASAAATDAKIRSLLADHDAAQVSVGVVRGLVSAGHDSIATALLLMDENDRKGRGIGNANGGTLSLPPVLRAKMLVQLRNVRAALSVLEAEYVTLSAASDFYPGCELYHAFQMLFNHAIVLGDFNTAKRCSSVLGREGTLRAFVDREGGAQAFRALDSLAAQYKNDTIAGAISALQLRVSNSSVAKCNVWQEKDVDAEGVKHAGPNEFLEMGVADSVNVRAMTNGGQDGETASLPPNTASSVSTILETSLLAEFSNQIIAPTAGAVGGFTAPTMFGAFEEDGEQQAGQADGGSTSSASTASIESVKVMLSNAVTAIDAGRLEEAFDVCGQALQMHAVCAKKDRALMIALVWHRIAARIMKRVVECLERARDETKAPTPQQKMEAKRYAAHYATVLTEIPLRPDQWIRGMNAAINFNLGIENYGLAAQGIRVLQSRSRGAATDQPEAQDQAQQLVSKLNLCMSKQMTNKYPQPGMSVCFNTLTFLGFGVPSVQCSLCPCRLAVPQNATLPLQRTKCSFCLLGTI